MTKNILSTCSSIKTLFESNISIIISIKQYSDEIFQIVSGRPLPNRIELISKKATTIIRKEKTLLNTNKELSSTVDKIEKIFLELLKNISNSKKLSDEDTYKEITGSIQRKNNELAKLRNANEYLNKEIIKLKDMLNATSSFYKFSNEELINICKNEEIFYESIKKGKEPQKRRSSSIDKREKMKNLKNEKDNKDKEKDNKENKQLKEQILKKNEEIKKIKEELALANEERLKLSEELKKQNSQDNDINSKYAENEKELKKLQDDFIKLTLENEERKTSISNKDSLIKGLMKDCDDKKKLIEEGKENIKNQNEEISKLK